MTNVRARPRRFSEMQLARRTHGLTERVSALSACFSFSRPVSYFLLSFPLSTRDRIVGGESERGGIGENVHKQKQLEPRARAIEVMQMMIMTARRGAWRMASGRAWERRDNDRGLIDTRRVDMD